MAGLRHDRVTSGFVRRPRRDIHPLRQRLLQRKAAISTTTSITGNRPISFEVPRLQSSVLKPAKENGVESIPRKEINAFGYQLAPPLARDLLEHGRLPGVITSE